MLMRLGASNSRSRAGKHKRERERDKREREREARGFLGENERERELERVERAKTVFSFFRFSCKSQKTNNKQQSIKQSIKPTFLLSLAA
jgi:hypothetical protein